MRPNHEGETGEGDISGVEVVLDGLAYVSIRCEYVGVTEGFLSKGAFAHLRGPDLWVMEIGRRHG